MVVRCLESKKPAVRHSLRVIISVQPPLTKLYEVKMGERDDLLQV